MPSVRRGWGGTLFWDGLLALGTDSVPVQSRSIPLQKWTRSEQLRGMRMLEQAMKSFLRRVIPGVLFLVTTCCIGSIGHGQITGLADAEKTLTDSGLEEIRPGVWSLKAADGNNFAARKFRLLRGKKHIQEALLFVGGKLEAPKTSNVKPGFSDTPPPPEEPKPAKTGIEVDSAVVEEFEKAVTPEEPEVPKKPNKENQQVALDLIRDAFAAEFENAEKPGAPPEKIKELANDLQSFTEDEPDSATRYVLFNEAIKLYLKTEDIENTFGTIDKLHRAFPEEDPLKYKYYGLKKIAERMPSGTKSRQAYQALKPHFKTLLDAAIKKDVFKWALHIAELNVKLAEKVKDRKAVKATETQLAEVVAHKDAYASVAAALEVLVDKPLDAEANQTVGEWHGFEKKNWPVAMSSLALGNHPDLQELAKADLENPTESDEQVEIGDRYWSLWDAWKGPDAQPNKAPPLQARAVYWYEKASPQLGGIVQKKVKKRIASWKGAQEQIAAKGLKEKQKPDGKAADKGKNRKGKQPVLAKKERFLTELKALRPQAPRGPAGKPLWNLGGRVLIQRVPVQVGKPTDIYLHPFSQPKVSSLTYNLKGQYKTLSGSVGIPDVRAWRWGPGAPTVFSVVLDGKRKILHTTRGIRGRNRFTLDVTGVKKLVLETSCLGKAIDGCFAFWYSPQVSPEKPSESRSQRNQNFTGPNQSIRIPGQQQRSSNPR